MSFCLDPAAVAEAVAAGLGCRLDCVARVDVARVIETYADQAAYAAASAARDDLWDDTRATAEADTADAAHRKRAPTWPGRTAP
jgi:hypothetical protein